MGGMDDRAGAAQGSDRLLTSWLVLVLMALVVTLGLVLLALAGGNG